MLIVQISIYSRAPPKKECLRGHSDDPRLRLYCRENGEGMIKIGVGLALSLLIVGCNFSPNKASDVEVVLPATEVGTPQGAKATRSIGPAGGTLASPDGRLTLTVPADALKETVAFSIQPVTNNAEGGLGLVISVFHSLYQGVKNYVCQMVI